MKDFFSFLGQFYPVDDLNGEFRRAVIILDPSSDTEQLRELCSPEPIFAGCLVIKPGMEAEFKQVFSIELMGNRLFLITMSSLLPALNLAALCEGGEGSVLDACAAPGGKSLMLSRLLPAFHLTANEYSRRRRMKMAALLTQVKVPARLMGMDARFIHRRTPDTYDLVLVDAPCSSDEHLVKNRLTERHSVRSSKNLGSRQKSLVYSGFYSLRPGGVMAYATCTGSVYEDELVVTRLLKKAGGEAELIPPQRFFLPDYTPPEALDSFGVAAEVARSCLRTFPQQGYSPSFLAMIRRLR